MLEILSGIVGNKLYYAGKLLLIMIIDNMYSKSLCGNNVLSLNIVIKKIKVAM